MRAPVVDALLAQEAMNDLHLLAESLDTTAVVKEPDSVCLVLASGPARTDPKRHTTARDLVGGGSQSRQHRRVTEGRRRHERPELEGRGPCRERSDRRPGIEHVPALVARGEVVVGAEERLDAAGLARLREGEATASSSRPPGLRSSVRASSASHLRVMGALLSRIDERAVRLRCSLDLK
jgi:hypothetical protein